MTACMDVNGMWHSAKRHVELAKGQIPAAEQKKGGKEVLLWHHPLVLV